jgi:LysM repeat protein
LSLIVVILIWGLHHLAKERFMGKILRLAQPMRHVSLLIALSIIIGGTLLPGTAWAAPLSGMDGPDCRSIHPVQYGQTLEAIAGYYGVGMYPLMQVNHLDNPNRIYAGQRLCIPGDMMMPSMSEMPSRPEMGHRSHGPMPGEFATYTVQPGDTLARIAWRYGVDVPYMMQLNGLPNPNCLAVGQVLKIGASGMPQSPAGPPMPQPPVVQPPQIMNDWHAAYYNNQDLQGAPVFERNDADINFNWDTGGPDNGVGNDNFSVRWTRDTYFSAGNYRFFVTVDDGVRLYVDNTLIIDAWRVQPATNYFGDIYLNPGNHTLRVEYYEETGAASIRLTWGMTR